MFLKMRPQVRKTTVSVPYATKLRENHMAVTLKPTDMRGYGSRNNTITHCRPAHGTVRKRQRKQAVTKHQENNLT